MKKKIRCPYFELNDLERAYHGQEDGVLSRQRENPTTMQSVGLVNDHARFCFRYKELARQCAESVEMW